MNIFNDKDKKLSQVLNFLPLLQRGIGIYHGELLPISKELRDIIQQRLDQNTVCY